MAFEIEIVENDSPAGRHVEDAEKIERLRGLAHDGMADAELLHHLIFGQQRIARLEPLVDDVFAKLDGQLFAEPFSADFGLRTGLHRSPVPDWKPLDSGYS